MSETTTKSAGRKSQPAAEDTSGATGSAADSGSGAAEKSATSSSSSGGMGTMALGDGPFTLINGSADWVIYNLAGQGFAGGERVTVQTVDRVGQQQVRTGVLLCQDADGTFITFDRKGKVSPRPLSTQQEATLGGASLA